MTLEELIAAVPIREFRGKPFYVRLLDIPEPWSGQFSRSLYGAGCPYFEGEGKCAYSHDWQRWVNSRSWGGVYAPTGLDPHAAQIAYVCKAVEVVYGISPDGLVDIAVVALKSRGKFTQDELEVYGAQLGGHVVELIGKCAAASYGVARK